MSEPLRLEPLPQKPGLPGTVVVRSECDEVIDAVAADLMVHAFNCVRTFGDFHMALSGGSTPLPLYERLMIDPNYRELPWERTHLWIVDERRVPFEDERSNYKHIAEILGDHSGVPKSQVHPIRAMSADADRAYEQELREVLGWREKGQDRLDYVLLGMGNDAHTASLFPKSWALMEEIGEWEKGHMSGAGKLVRINAGEQVTPPERVTMTLGLINASRLIAVMVTGKGKRETVGRVSAAVNRLETNRAEVVAEHPILGVKPLGGELRWYLDYEACPQ